MKWLTSRQIRVIGLVVVGLVLVGLSAAAMPRVKEWIKPNKEGATEKASNSNHSIVLDSNDPNTLIFRMPQARDGLGVKTAEVKKATESRPLELNGSLAPNTDRLLPLRSRFPGEVMEIGQVTDRDKENRTELRDVGNGDFVEKNQLLAVVWSKDLGLTKSSLLDALSKLRLDEDVLQKYEKLYEQGAQTERNVREAERNVASDRIAVNAAELTLRSWRLTDQEIKEIYDEADRLARQIAAGKRVKEDPEQWKKWARVEVRAPFDGRILEKNLALGAIVDTTTNLFIIGDLTQLTVWANAYEEDLPLLQKLPRPIVWKIRLKAEPDVKPLEGTVQEIRPILDPTQHTALVKGRVQNPEHRLVAGQFITATIEIPPSPGEVVIPTTALIEDGQESIVFVQPDPEQPRYTWRRVAVARRGRDIVHLRSELTAKEREAGLAALRPGEWVVTSGALEMSAALKDLQEAKAPERK